MNLIPMGAGCAVDFMNSNDFVIHDKTFVQYLKKATKPLHGKCTVQIIDSKTGKITKEKTHDNTVTPWIENAINKGNFLNSMPSAKMLPMLNWLCGVQALSKQGDATKMMIPPDARVIACANNGSGSESNDLRRGNYNQDSSSILLDDDGRVNGFKFVWYWPDTRGNCIADEYIKAICLTRPTLAIARYGDTMPDDTTLSELLARYDVAETLAKCQIIDYDGECAFFVDVSNGKIIVKQYQLDTKQYHIMGVFNSDGVYDVTREIADEEITPQTAISNFNYGRASVSYYNGIIHLLEWQDNSTTIVDHAIDPSDWSETSTSYTYSFDMGVKIKNGSTSGSIIFKDLILYTTGFLWVKGTDDDFYKCSLTIVANVTKYESVGTDSSNGVFVELPNGDWIKYSFAEDNVARVSCDYYHNDTVYGAYDVYDALYGYGEKFRAVNMTGYGTMIASSPHSGRYASNNYVSLYVPVGHVATVWNDTDEGGDADQWQKTAGRTMRVIYEITEEEPTP